MPNYLIPRIERGDLPPMLAAAALGAILAGLYGILHDQCTYAISPEYFTNMKSLQFSYADFGFGERVFASTVGFLGTWWVGLILGWFLARRLVPNQSRPRAWRQMRAAFLLIFVAAALSGLLGYAYGLWRGPDADYSLWIHPLRQFYIADTWAFVRVAYIHYASYAGGLAGFLAALVLIRPKA